MFVKTSRKTKNAAFATMMGFLKKHKKDNMPILYA
jgi:hypothetical protein